MPPPADPSLIYNVPEPTGALVLGAAVVALLVRKSRRARNTT